jgi:hypothetical protein
VNGAAGLLLLLIGLALLGATGALAAASLRLRSPVAFLLAAYLVAWGWLIAVSFALSPARALTRYTLLGGLVAGLVLAWLVWRARGRPAPPALGVLRGFARPRDPALLVLAVAVAAAGCYVVALAFLTPANDWDALSYHLPRAAFWKQEHGIAYIEGTADARLNHNPPNAEIGQLATMLLSGRDRYAALPQLLAYAALVLAVAGLARRIGLDTRQATFGALAFATLPVIVLQSSGALNDVVVASYLAAAAYFALGAGAPALPLLALAVALAVGTKFSGIVALPTLALVTAVGTAPARWPRLALAGAAGLAGGCVWYVVNAVETGALDGGAAEETGQRADLGVSTVTSALRLALGFIDMSGAPWRISLLFLVGAGVLAGLALVARRRSTRLAGMVLAAAALTAAVIAYPLLMRLGVRIVYKTSLLLGVPVEFLDEVDWELNTKAEPTRAWYGPLAPVLLVAGTVAAVLAWRRRSTPVLAVALAAAPWVLLATLAVTVTWDPWRGRFLAFGVALAAATWGLLLRSRVLAAATAAIGATAVFLALANYDGKPSGLFSEPTIWGNPRWQAQTRLSGSQEVLRFVQEGVPVDASLAVALPGNHQIQPYFGPTLARHISLIPIEGGAPEPDAEWLVRAPGTTVRQCDGSWAVEFEHQGWSVERRAAPDACFSG